MYYFSGFQRSPSEYQTVITVDSTKASSQKDSTNSKDASIRTSKRLKTIKEETDRLKPDEKLLAKMLMKKRWLRPKEQISVALSRFSPTVKLKKLSKFDVFKATDDWSFLRQFYFNYILSFRCEIIAQHIDPISKSVKVLVTFSPPEVIEDRWINRNDLPLEGLIKVDIQSMNWKQKLLVRSRLFIKQ